MTDQLKPIITWRSAIVASDLPPTTRLVALTLALHMNEAGGSAFPGAARLARESGLNIDTVRRHRTKLMAEGWLLLVEQGGVKGGKRRANAYEARVPEPALERPPAENDPTFWEATPSREPGVPPAENDPSSSFSSPLSSSHRDDALRTAPERKRDPIFEALIAACGYDATRLTPVSKGPINAALKELRAAEATPEEIAAVAAAYRRRMPNAELTAPALAKHFARLVTDGPGEQADAQLRRLAENREARKRERSRT